MALMVNYYGITPTSEHHACLVDIVSRAGQLEEACNLILAMPFEADSGIWSSLLAACEVHANVELGELAAKKIWIWTLKILGLTSYCLIFMHLRESGRMLQELESR